MLVFQLKLDNQKLRLFFMTSSWNFLRLSPNWIGLRMSSWWLSVIRTQKRNTRPSRWTAKIMKFANYRHTSGNCQQQLQQTNHSSPWAEIEFLFWCGQFYVKLNDLLNQWYRMSVVTIWWFSNLGHFSRFQWSKIVNNIIIRNRF